ncbi:MAG TPA: hypothetical protein VHB98_16105 [Chloroflexota bacterium]|nr:hypothetical protein [Chloroflexota bacterium]
MKGWRVRGALLLVLPGVAAIGVLRQPSAGALSVQGGAIYVIPIATATVAPVNSLSMVRMIHMATAAVAPADSPPVVRAVRAVATETGSHPTLARIDNYGVRGTPTISVALINQVLAAYGSPLAGQGQALYDLGIEYGIDPAYCLAFFVQESDAGTRGEAVLTHSVGNLRPESGAPSLDGYRYYDTWLEGAEDWYRLISNVYVEQWGLSTVDAIIPVYAPGGDNNDVASYITTVEQLVSAWRAQSAG